MAASKETRRTSLELNITGMNCASCVGRVEKALLGVPGVLEASVNLANGRATLKLALTPPEAAALEKAVVDAGYQATVARDRKADSERRKMQELAESEALKRAFLLATVLTFPIFVLEMGSHLIPAVADLIHGTLGHRNSWLLQFVLTTIVLAGPGRRFFQHGMPALLRLAPDMNSLVMLGTSAAWGYSCVVTFMPSVLPSDAANVYYEAAAVIVTLILMGRYLEVRAKGRTGEAIARLMSLQPETAKILCNGVIQDVPIANVQPGDHVIVQPGERVPLDGELLEGHSYVDESMLTGEPLPINKAKGSKVTGGTINGTGSFTFRVSRVGEDTVLARIVQMVEVAQGSKLPIQSLVDKVTLWFVPVVIIVAVLTFGYWLILAPVSSLSMALINAVAVLIVACPCAMGLATPVSIMVATGRSAEMGVLFRNGHALQMLSEARTIAFDKTGTITQGKPEMTDFLVQPGFDEPTVLAMVAAVESRSEHPIAHAIVSAASKQDLQLPEVADFDAVPGYGLRATVNGQRIDIGTDRLLGKLGLDASSGVEIVVRLTTQAKTPIYVAIAGRLAAVIAVADQIRQSTPEAIAALRAAGFRTAMITGDSTRTANAIAESLQLDQVYAEVLPEGKVQVLQSLKSENNLLAYVGDGINDAPALAEADIGIAMGNGTDIAIESADVVLMTGELGAVVNAVFLARATMRNIRENLFWAFAYNVALIPLAAGVLYPAFGILLSPVFAAGAMALSSIFVLGNALRLKTFRAKF
ncbi:MAG: heavy metal translocating P-type ATPase [Gammaproteobacteria bacterium]|nr:heavy metal translocating P-type ATPase [Gammaproteobacteria bacterium]MDP2141167.1 heavy metal translocating P-type ATPase [Gammaproteobacteria bacterium]MDP2349159.1 heavy metal translocating P-type ATPase [Gammaproteobacteria bacterium]